MVFAQEIMTSTYQPPHSYSHPPPPPNNMSDNVRLPSLKDLNFQYRSPGSQESPPLANGPPPPSEHGRSRHEVASWNRPPPPQSSVNGAPVSASHETSKSHLYTPQKTETAYMTPGLPASQQPGSNVSGPNGAASAPPRGDMPPQSLKRTRSPAVSASPGRSPHVSEALPCIVYLWKSS